MCVQKCPKDNVLRALGISCVYVGEDMNKALLDSPKAGSNISLYLFIFSSQ